MEGGKLTDEQKLKAIETYFQWSMTNYDEAVNILEHIYWVVFEGRLKDDEEKKS